MSAHDDHLDSPLGTPLGAPLGAPSSSSGVFNSPLGAPSSCSGVFNSPLGAPSSCSGVFNSNFPELELGAPREEALGAPREAKGWYLRYLPHRDEPGVIQFITYRLADSIPSALLAQIETEIQSIPPSRKDSERRQKIEALLDMGHGSGILRDPQAAECVIKGWSHFDEQRYDLVAWVVMPTHVHVMIRLFEGESLPKIVQSWKSFTGKHLKARFPQVCVNGEFWMREYWDRYIRDEKHFHNAVDYIRQNPVKAGLAAVPGDWPYLGVSPLGAPSSSSGVINSVFPELELGAPRKHNTSAANPAGIPEAS